jgi:hypothetical protein
MHCAEVEGQNIAVQVYQTRRASGNFESFSASAPPFVPSGQMFPYPTQVHHVPEWLRSVSLILARLPTQRDRRYSLWHSFMGLDSKFSLRLWSDQAQIVIAA